MTIVSRQIVRVALTFLLLGTSFQAAAQQPKTIPRVGILAYGGRSSLNVEALQQGLKDLGYVGGRNIAIEHRMAEGKTDRLPRLAAELIGLKVDILYISGGTPAVLAARNATNVIPIIFVGTIDPVATGLVASLARPGGNVTGLSIGAPGLAAKRLEIIAQTVPKLSRVRYLMNPSIPGGVVGLEEARGAAKGLGVQVQSLEVRSGADFDSAFETASNTQTGALIVAPYPPMNTNQKQIVELAAKRRIPAIYADADWVFADGLMAYGPSISDLHRRAATYVDKILKGARPAELPVEQPTKFEFVVNLKTAKQIGLTIPPNVLARADRVIR